MKRPRLEDNTQNANSTIVTAIPASAPFVVGNRLGGGITVTAKTATTTTNTAAKPKNGKGDHTDVVVLE
ncbi:AGAP009343-PA [Anopheles gambiae str. PEST]|nr:AGAP009343-PA [Anopheles gambiae str. PEST]